MFKKLMSVLLAVMMVVSVLTVAVVTTSADGLDEGTLYFDASTTGWTLTSKSRICFYIYSDEGNVTEFGDKYSRGVYDKDLGLHGFNLADNEVTLEKGKQYKIIFSVYNGGDQTGTLLFDTTCLGHVAYCDGTEYEVAVDSSKTALAAFWRDMDASVVGPALEITSTGKVIGTCPPQGTTPYTIFTTFLVSTGAQSLANARQYSGLTDQELIESIGAGLGLSKDEVKAAIEEAGVTTEWNYDDSNLPESSATEATDSTESTEGTEHTHTAGAVQIENDNASTCKEAGSYDEVIYCTECGEEMSRETKYHELAAHTPGAVQIENDNASTCKVAGSYDEVTYCTVCGDETSRETKYHELAAHTPGAVQIENDHTSTCKVAGAYDEVTYCTVCGDETSRETKYHALAAHTAGTPVEENITHATCGADGSYDLVTYCTVCGDEISRQKDIVISATGEHSYKFVEEKAPQGFTPGAKAHYECETCGKLFFLVNENYEEVTEDEIVLEPQTIRGDANRSGAADITDCTHIQRWLLKLVAAADIDLKAADADDDGEVTIIDVTLIQRVDLGICDWDRNPLA